MNILVVGCGFVGLTVAASFADHGQKVYGIDINSSIVDTINSSKSHFFEPGLDSLISKHLNTSFFCSARVSDFIGISFDAVIISVGTPIAKSGSSYCINTLPIERALRSITPLITINTLIVLRSTVKVGTTRSLVADYLSDLFKCDKFDLLLSFCPERTVEGNALAELKSLPQIISGINPSSLHLSTKLFDLISSELVPVSSLEAAELVKLFNNTYRDTLFAISNLFNSIAQSFNLDGHEIIGASNHHYPRSNIAKPGFVGGPCLTKDAHILVDGLSDDLGSFVRSARDLNATLPTQIADWVEKLYRAHHYDFVSISGLAFKGFPATSDLRDSPSMTLVDILSSRGIPLMLHDFEVFDHDVSHLSHPFCSDIIQFVESSQFLLLLNNHPSYSSLSCDIFSNFLSSKTPYPVLFDLWGVLPPDLSQTTNYFTIGNFLTTDN